MLTFVQKSNIDKFIGDFNAAKENNDKLKEMEAGKKNSVNSHDSMSSFCLLKSSKNSSELLQFKDLYPG